MTLGERMNSFCTIGAGTHTHDLPHRLVHHQLQVDTLQLLLLRLEIVLALPLLNLPIPRIHVALLLQLVSRR